MSVDTHHRKQFCKLLKTRFAETQFIITTHDQVWAKQMRTEGLVEAKGGVVFQNWSVQAGPVFEQLAEVWEEIEVDLAKNDISAAAARLRRYMEYIAPDLADQLGARPTYRGDLSYDLGDLLPVSISRHGELLETALKSAAYWKDEAAKAKVEAMKAARTAALTAHRGEDWIVNKAIHFNEWANFTKAEFREVVAAFKALLQLFRCPREECDSLLYVMPRKGTAEQLRCGCMNINVNLKVKA